MIGASVEEAPIAIRITIELLLYSGRPNPVFALSGGAAAEFERRVAALPAAADRAALPDGLGYRGLRIVAEGAGFEQVIVADGRVEIHSRGGKVECKADPGRALERWLIAAGAPHLSADQVAWLGQELAR